MSTSATIGTINGIDTSAFFGANNALTEDPAKGATKWKVTSHWPNRFNLGTAIGK